MKTKTEADQVKAKQYINLILHAIRELNHGLLPDSEGFVGSDLFKAERHILAVYHKYIASNSVESSSE